MSAKTAKVSTEERNEKVRAVLRESLVPLGPTEIARQIGEEWCGALPGMYPSSAAITPILRRIGAVGVNGKWSLASDPKSGKA